MPYCTWTGHHQLLMSAGGQISGVRDWEEGDQLQNTLFMDLINPYKSFRPIYFFLISVAKIRLDIGFLECFDESDFWMFARTNTKDCRMALRAI